MVSVWHQSTTRAIRKQRIHLLSYRSRGTLMSNTEHSVQRRLKSNAPINTLRADGAGQGAIIDAQPPPTPPPPPTPAGCTLGDRLVYLFLETVLVCNVQNHLHIQWFCL